MGQTQRNTLHDVSAGGKHHFPPGSDFNQGERLGLSRIPITTDEDCREIVTSAPN